jgi:hypothetical protein
MRNTKYLLNSVCSAANALRQSVIEAPSTARWRWSRIRYWIVVVADELVAADDAAGGTVGGAAAGSTMTVRVEVLVKPSLSVTT